MATHDVGALLATATYARLFETTSASLRAAILAGPNAHGDLRTYLSDRSKAETRRFLAAELLHRAAPGFPDENEALELPRLYAAALHAAQDGGAWGVPGRWDGPAMEHLIQLGPAALRPLRPLLTLDRAIRYIGSTRAMMGRRYGVRIKDLAAHAVARILVRACSVDAPSADQDAAMRWLVAAEEVS
jgi:hypothetical protein